MTSHRLQPSTFVPRAALALAFFLVAQSSPARLLTTAEQMVSDVRVDIERGDCGSAVSTLDKGLKAHYPEVQLLAGSLYENGVCLKPNWDRAVNFYSLAYKNGKKEGAYRLAAGFAAPQNGPDVASALWWSSRVNPGLDACVPSGAARDDADKFLADVKTWSDARIGTCNYIVGVFSTIMAEVRYPAQASHWAVGGKVTVTFRPATAGIQLTLNGTEKYLLTGVYSGDRLWEENDKQIGSAFVKNVRAVADRALKRYPKPDGIPADTPDATLIIDFGMEDARLPHYF